MNQRCAVAAVALLAAAPLAAGEIVGAFGADELRGERHAAAGLEVRTGPLWSRSRFDLGLGAAFEVDDDFWAGAGPVMIVPLMPRWRLEASVMLGYYDQGDGGDDLGTDFPIFRSQIGASYTLAEGWWLGAAINYMSNARTADYNPGVETVLFALAREF